jgi:hypothetical protein
LGALKSEHNTQAKDSPGVWVKRLSSTSETAETSLGLEVVAKLMKI